MLLKAKKKKKIGRDGSNWVLTVRGGDGINLKRRQKIHLNYIFIGNTWILLRYIFCTISSKKEQCFIKEYLNLFQLLYQNTRLGTQDSFTGLTDDASKPGYHGPSIINLLLVMLASKPSTFLDWIMLFHSSRKKIFSDIFSYWSWYIWCHIVLCNHM